MAPSVPYQQIAPAIPVGWKGNILADFAGAIAAESPGATISSVTLSAVSPSGGLAVSGSTLDATSTGVLIRVDASAAVALTYYYITVTPTLSDAAATVDPRTLAIPVQATSG